MGNAVTEALLIVDLQNDFVPPDGALAVPRGEEVVPYVDALAHDERFAAVFATRDWHPPDHGSFSAQGGPWPPHCVQGTPGAELHAGLDRWAVDVVVDAGDEPALEGYSGFEATRLEEELHARGIDAVTVVGLATDYCVRATALDAAERGFRVTVETRGIRGIAPDTSKRALAELRAAGVEIR